MDDMTSEVVIELFKFTPAIVALLCVIFLLYKIIIRKDETINRLVNGSQADIERQAKMLTLLEILVSRGASNNKEKK